MVLYFAVEDAPQGTVSVAIVLEDKDAYPVTGGFAWIHWLAEMLEIIVEDSAGSGMVAMFLCTGICGFTVSMASCFNREIKKIN